MLALAVRLLPTIISLVNRLFVYLHDRRMIRAGELQAFAKQSAALNASIARACAIEQEAAAIHARDASDSAFDPDYIRGDE